MRKFFKHKITGKEWEIVDRVEDLNLIKLIDQEGNRKSVPATHLLAQYEQIQDVEWTEWT